MNFRPPSFSTDPEDELRTCLTTFTQFYRLKKTVLQRASESLVLAAARVQETQQIRLNRGKVLRGVFGGLLGGVGGTVTGGVVGTMGGVGAVTCFRLSGEVNAVGATVGFFSSVCGGVAGGAFSGSVGGAVGAAVLRGSGHEAASEVVSFIVGATAGGAIGAIFGGSVGAAGGAVGGGLGGLFGSRLAVCLVRAFADGFSETEDSKQEEMKMIQKPVKDFTDTVELLVIELRRIKTICDEMSSDLTQRVSRQTAKTLGVAAEMEETITMCQRATDFSPFVSGVKEAAKRSRRTCDELEETNRAAETLLLSLKKH